MTCRHASAIRRLDEVRALAEQPPTRVGRGLLLLVDQTAQRALPLTNTLAVPLAVTSPDVMAP